MSMNKNKVLKIFSAISLVAFSSFSVAARYEPGAGSNGVDNILGNLQNEFNSLNQQSPLQKLKNNYQMAFKLIQQNKLQEAEQKLQDFIKNDSRQSAYYSLLALIALQKRDIPLAERHYKKALELNANDVQALTGLAKLFLEKKQYKLAEQYAEQAIKANPHAINAYKIKADVLLKQQDLEAVEDYLTNAYHSVEGDLKTQAGLVSLLGKLYLVKKEPENFLQWAHKLVEQYPGETMALAVLADAQIASRKFADARKTLEKIIAKNPKDVGYRFLLAKLLSQQKGQEDKVLTLLNKAAENAENPNIILAYKTAFLLKQKQYEQAFDIAQTLKKAHPELSIGYILSGDVYLAQQQYQKALENYQQAYEKTPTLKLLDVQLAVFKKLGKTKQAINLLENELKKRKDNPQIIFRLANTYQNSGNYKQASQYYQQLLKSQPENALFLNNLAWAYNQMGDSRALKTAEKAYQLAAKSAAVADTYGYILNKQGQTQKAIDILKKALEKAPDMAELQLHLAEAYHAAGNDKQAKTILQQVSEGKSNLREKARRLMDAWFNNS